MMSNLIYSIVFIGIISLLSYSNCKLRCDIQEYSKRIKVLSKEIQDTQISARKVSRKIRKMK